MKRLMILGAMIALFGLGTAAAFAATSNAPSSPPGQSGNDQVCPGADSGKIDVSGSNASITVTAPEGELISGYCVKAGSANQGLGPEFYTVDPPAKTVTITHSSGKDISHYSLTFFTDETTTTETTTEETTTEETTTEETTTEETTTEETTTTETTSTETTQTETSSTETTPTESNPDPASPPVVQPGVFTPPTSAKPKPTTDEPGAVAGVVVTATTPTKAPQAAPFTP